MLVEEASPVFQNRGKDGVGHDERRRIIIVTTSQRATHDVLQGSTTIVVAVSPQAVVESCKRGVLAAALVHRPR